MKPSVYRHIAAWGRHHGWSHQEISGAQRAAANRNAPIDAVYVTFDGDIVAGTDRWFWKTIADVGVRTRMAIEVELNRGK